MKSIVIVCAVLALPSISNARNLRDGCPNGRRDSDFTKYGRFGAFAGTESLLQTNRVSLSGAGTYISSDGTAGVTRKYLSNRVDGIARYANFVAGLSVATVVDFTADEGAPPAYGMLTIGGGWVRRFRTALYAKPEASRDELFSPKETDALAGVRKARGWMINANIRRTDTNRGPVDVGMVPSLAADDDEKTDYRLDGFGARFEYRTEIVGCYAPFLHVELTPRWSLPLDADEMAVARYGHVLVAAAALSTGLQVSDWFSVYGQYRVEVIGAELITTTDPMMANKLSLATKHRFRLGIELAPHRQWRFNGALDLAPESGIGFGFTATFVNDEAYR